MEDEDSQSIRSKRPAQKCSDLIVLGLPWKVNEDDLEDYFKSYGDLVMKMVSCFHSKRSLLLTVKLSLEIVNLIYGFWLLLF